MTVPDHEGFDDWYANIAASTRWDPLVRGWLNLPDSVESTGYLSGDGLREVCDQLALSEGQTLVELGCGRAGYGLAVVAATGAHLVGVDFSSVALDAAEAATARLGLGGRAQFQLGDLADTGLPNAVADAALCVDALHFASSVVAAAQELRRLVRPGGTVVVTAWEPVDAEAADRLPERLRRMDLGRDLVAAGWDDVTVSRRPDWEATEAAFWRAAADLDPGGDRALVDLREEAREFLPLVDALARVVAVARTP